MATPARAVPIRELAAVPASVDPHRLVESADLLRRCRLAVRGALGSRHLVDVAFELAVARGWTPDALEAFGVPLDLLDCFPRWRERARRPFVPGTSDLRLAPSGAAMPLGTLRLQLSPTPGTIPHALRLLRDLLGRLDRATQFVVVVEPGANLDALDALTDRFQAGARSRVRFVPMRTISVFAQDNARAARTPSGAAVLLVPRAFRASDQRAEDEIDPVAAQEAFGVTVRRSRLYWEGGNVIQDDERCFVGVDTVAENVARFGLTDDEVVALLEVEFGMPIALLGRRAQARYDGVAERLSASGQASFHIDLDVALLGRLGRSPRPRALVADPARGLDFVDDVLSVRRLVHGHFLPAPDITRHLRAEYEAYAAERHPRLLEYASQLADRGYRAVAVPDLRLDPRMDVFRRVNMDFGYCNVLPGARAGRPAVHYFPSGVRALDRDAARCLSIAGVEPVRVSTAEVAGALMLLHGGLHCCCGTV